MPVVAVLALLATATAPSAVHYASPGAGPSALCDCVKQLRQPGDECRLRAGRYEVGAARCEVAALRGTEAQPMRITSAGDGDVLIDGTLPIAGPWTANGGHFTAPSGGHEILQLFVDGELQVLARFPNAPWSDKGVFFGVKNWLRSKVPGVHNLLTGEGLLRDQGKCQPGDTLGTCNSHDLAASGLNATGALGVLNLYSCDTGIQRIVRHDASDPSVLHYDATWKGLCDGYKFGFGRYFLEGLDEFLDHDEEWLLDLEQQVVKRASPPPRGAEVRGRVSDYALVVNGSSWLEISNLSFHATTLSVAGDISNVTLSALEFNYSAVSRRSLGQDTPPVGLTVWRDTTLDRRGSHYCCNYMDNTCCPGANLLIDDVIVRYSDGPALMVSGDKTTLRDCLFEWNDWTAVGGSWPLNVPKMGKAHRATTVWADDTEGLVLERLTFRNNGAAQSITAGGDTTAAARVEMCSFESQLAIQDDGSFVEGGGRPSTNFIRNWCTNTGKEALRWDGVYESNAGPTGGVMLENVAWNTSALMIKGDRHNVTSNTAFGGASTSLSRGFSATDPQFRDRPQYQDHLSALDNLSIPSAMIGVGRPYQPLADALSVFAQNIFDSAALKGNHNPRNATLPGTWQQNLLGHVDLGAPSEPLHTVTASAAPGGYSAAASPPTTRFDIRAELRDPYHHDFRPCPGSQAAALSAGAYPVWSPADITYWIPGRRERVAASTPVPPAGSIGVHLNTELMFLPARLSLSHSVYFGKAGSPLLHLEDLSGPTANIARPRAHLEPSTRYVWRVDTHTAAGLVTGAEWTLRTGTGELSCQITPHPPPQPGPDQPPPPGPGQCPQKLNALCQGLAGRGARCEACLSEHSAVLVAAGCWVQGGSRAQTFALEYCGGTSPPSPPTPDPHPPPAGRCATRLAKDGCKPSLGAACGACADAHRSDLKAAGCTQAAVKSFCKLSGPAPTPRPPPPAPAPPIPWPPGPPGSCPSTGCFPCAGCWCKPTWDGGAACASSFKRCNHTTGNSCPSVADCQHGELQRQLGVAFGAAVNRDGHTDRLRLNVYQPPASDTRVFRPAAVCIAGGGFRTGDRNKGETNTWAKHLASRGFVAITIDYRLERPPRGQEPQNSSGTTVDWNRDAAHDAKAAVRWLVKHSQEYRVSTDHIVAFGSSAGGMMVAWLTAVRGDGEGSSGNPGFPSNITAGISLSGFLLPTEYSQVTRAGQTPYLDFHGTADTTVPLAAAEATHAEFVAKHDPAALIEIPGAAHTPWDAMEQRSDDFFGFLTTYARLGELQCPEKV